MADVTKKFWNDLPERDWKGQSCPKPQFDQFAPPKTARMVHCLHCGLKYDSRLIAWGRKVGMQIAGDIFDPALWWCPTPVCDGGGYRYDIHEIGTLGGKDAEPLTAQTVANWRLRVINAGTPKRGKAKYADFLKHDEIHNEWLLACMASIKDA